MSSDEPQKKRDPDASAPVDIEKLDSAWDDDDLDEDATMVAKIPKDLVELSRRDPEKGLAALQQFADKIEAPEKHEAITARPPPPAAEGDAAPAKPEPSVVVDAPHEKIADADHEDDEDDEDEEEEDEAAEGDEEARARAADEAAGLDAEARRKRIEERAGLRRDKARAKTIAAKEKRKQRQEEQRAKQKKPKKRSTPPPRPEGEARADEKPPTSRERPTIPPGAEKGAAPLVGAPKRDWMSMALLVAIVIVVGALVIGLARR